MPMSQMAFCCNTII
jgi:hypothetical protein